MLLLDKNGELMPQCLHHFLVIYTEYLQGPPFQYLVFCHLNITLVPLTHCPSLQYIYVYGENVKTQY